MSGAAEASRAARTRFVTRAPGKVNLCLYVGPVRDDGLHELVSLVQAVSLADELALEPAGGGAAGDEVACAGVEGPNLAAAALAAYRAATAWDAPPQRLEILKRVPVAGGMGGGSADAAAALRLAAHSAGRPDDPACERIAPALGADVPVLLRPGLALMTGAGEVVEPVPGPAELGLLILPDPEPLSTPEVYAEADRLGLCRSAEELAAAEAALRDALAAGDGVPPRELLVNDLQDAARSLRPRIDEALGVARDAGAAAALVSGSGPTVFGLFGGVEGPALAAAAAEALAGRFPGASAAVPVDPAFAAVREAAP